MYLDSEEFNNMQKINTEAVKVKRELSFAVNLGEFLTCFKRQSCHCIVIQVLWKWSVLLMSHLKVDKHKN